MAFAPPSTLVVRQWHSARKRRTSACTTMSLSRVLVVGGNRGVGLEVSRLIGKRPDVEAVVGTSIEPEDAYKSNGVHRPTDSDEDAVRMDLLDMKSIANVLEEHRPSCIISCSALSTGVKNLMETLTNSSSSVRFLLLSELGAGDSENDVPSQVYFTMRASMLDKSLSESFVKNSGVPNWTIARPGPLIESSASEVSDVVLTEGHKCYGTVSKESLAEGIVKAVESDKSIGKTLAIVNRSGVLHTSPYVRPLEFWEPLPFEEFAL